MTRYAYPDHWNRLRLEPLADLRHFRISKRMLLTQRDDQQLVVIRGEIRPVRLQTEPLKIFGSQCVHSRNLTSPDAGMHPLRLLASPQ